MNLSLRRTTRTAVAFAFLGMLLGPPLVAFGADNINIDNVDVSPDGERLTLLLGVPQGSTPDLDSVQVDLGGIPATSETKIIQSGDVQRTVVLALDASNSMARDQKFEAAKDAANAYVAAAPDDVRIGLLTFSNTVNIVAEPTTDHAALSAAIDDITLTRGTRVYDAVEQASDLTGTTGARSVLLLSDGKDQGNGATIEEAIETAIANEVVVDVVALDQAPEQLALMTQLAEATGGDVVASDPDSLAATFEAQARALSTQLVVDVKRPADANDQETDLTVSLTADGLSYSDTALVRLPARIEGPRPVEPDGTIFGPAFLWIGALTLTLGLGGLLAMVLAGERGPSFAQTQIDHYSRSGSQPWQSGSSSAIGKKPGSTSSARVNFKDSAVALTERVVRGDFESRLTSRIAGAGLTLTSAEWLLLHSAIAVSSGLVGLILRGPTLMVLLFLFGLVAPWMYLTRRHRKRLAAFHSQLAETLQLIAGGLSAGLSLPQSVDTVVREGSEPMAGELRRVLVEQRLGIDITDALNGVAVRMDSTDFAWVVMAIRIQREVGGNLSELLTTVSETLRERDYLRRQVGVLSAEGRISAWILGALPIVMFTYVAIVRPEFIRPLLTEPVGVLMLGGAIVLLLAGFWSLSRIVKVEV